MARVALSRKQLLQAAGVLTGALLAGCGPLGESGGAATGSKLGGAPVTLVIWENALFKWREDIGKQFTDALMAANPWLTLETSVPAGDAHDKFLAASAAGTAPDIYSSGSYWAQQDLVDGVTIVLEPYLKTSKLVQKKDIWPS